MTLYRLTRASARAADACYSDARIAELVPPEGLSPEEVAELDIPAEDRRWALICACGAPPLLLTLFAYSCVTAARTAAIIAVAARAARADYAVYAADAAQTAAADGDGVGAARAGVAAALCAVDDRPDAVSAAVIAEQIRVLVALLQGDVAP
jgi:hypothetical protein